MRKLLGKIRARAWRLSMWGLSRGPHVTRYFMYRHLKGLGETLLAIPEFLLRLFAVGNIDAHLNTVPRERHKRPEDRREWTTVDYMEDNDIIAESIEFDDDLTEEWYE